jgi:hypothetical protein
MRWQPALFPALLACVGLVTVRGDDPQQRPVAPVPSAAQLKLNQIAHFFEYNAEGDPAVQGRVLKNDRKDQRTRSGVAIDGTFVVVFHTLEKTPTGLRLKRSIVQDTMFYALDKDGNRVMPGRSGYRIEVAEIELMADSSGDRVFGFMRNISNSRYDPIGWAVEVSELRVTNQEGGKRGRLVMKMREITRSGSIDKKGAVETSPSAWEEEIAMSVNGAGKLEMTDTYTDYTVDPKTGTRTMLEPDPKAKIENPNVYSYQEG